MRSRLPVVLSVVLPAAVAQADGPAGGALLFDGIDDVVRIPISPSLTPDQMTVEAWVQLLGPQVKFARIIREDENWLLGAANGNDKITAWTRKDGDVLTAIDPTHHESYINRWRHVAAVYSLTSVTLYIDGQLVDQVAHPGGPLEHLPAEFLHVGNAHIFEEPLHAVMDDLRIWNVARSQQDIKATMHRALAGDESGLVGAWTFDEPDGQDVNDLSPFANHAWLGAEPTPDPRDPQRIASTAPIVEGSLQSLEITPIPEVAEGHVVTFQAHAAYEQGPSVDVSADAVWEVDPAIAGTFDGPGLSVSQIPPHGFPITVSATFTDGTTVTAMTSSEVLPTGAAGAMLQFDGDDDRVQVPVPLSLVYPGYGGWSVEAWVRVDSPPANKPTGVIIQESICLDGADPYALFLKENHAVWVVGNYDGLSEALIWPIEVGRWVHLAGTYEHDGELGLMTLYVNGIPVHERETDVLIDSTFDPVFIGHVGNYCFNFDSIHGAIDEAAIWSARRTGEEIRSTMYARLLGDEPGLLAYWRFDTEGQEVTDLSPNAHHGYLGSDPFLPDDQDPEHTPASTPLGPPPCPADFNDDGTLSILDFVAFQLAFAAQHPSADLNRDGALDVLDFVTFQQHFVAGCD